MQPKELRNKYFHFFQEKQHSLIPSASLVPINDSSVLFITAGMQPLVPFLKGEKHSQGVRLVNMQKCLRTVDFENIGDNTHNTFFQMLGNWSLGDYFKQEAIKWSFEFLTDKKWLNIPLSKLAFTVYQGDEQVPKDEESFNLWKSLGVSEKRIAYLGEDNFWSAGDTGPCGPSSEMFYWTGKGEAPETFDPENEAWVEIWNDVFMTYNRMDGGSLVPLAKKNVDTGMGFERTLAVLNGEESAYETGLFKPIIDKIEKLSGKKYVDNLKEFRIICDHLRAAVFIIADGVVPSNLDRGYVLRRLIRRAIRFGKMIGLNSFIGEISSLFIKNYVAMYPDLEDSAKKVISELEKEEERFNLTLEKGLREFEKLSKNNISGKDAFLLFQSYGFPLEMTQELAAEKNLKVDEAGFHKEFETHQEKSRTATEGKFKGGLADHSDDVVKMHTATHLLNEALRKVLSSDIHQRGSNINPERLRFDFNFERKLTPEEVKSVEDEVNRVINLCLDVVKKEMPLEEAEKLGAQKEFGVKYPEIVSVYFVGDYSKEFCGGPHVRNTKEIGHFKIVKEQSSAAGVRRIKAVVE